ncbi:MAG TPA: YesL family protein [Lachnospiraceae bacterium]|nr:YesL family protein [Lachnospiraceae bacterium]
MNRIFDMEGPVFTTLNRLADLVWLNILYIICCIPIFTIGASTTAMYYVTMKMAKNEEGYITRSFFKSFKLNFKQATLLWLLALAAGGILLLDYAIMGGRFGDIVEMNEILRKVVTGILFAVGGLYVFVMIYLFPLLAKFDNSIKNTIKNALLISIRHFPFTLLLIVIPVVPFVLMYFVNQLVLFVFFLVFSLVAFASSYIYVKIFANYLPGEEKTEDETGEREDA